MTLITKDLQLEYCYYYAKTQCITANRSLNCYNISYYRLKYTHDYIIHTSLHPDTTAQNYTQVYTVCMLHNEVLILRYLGAAQTSTSIPAASNEGRSCEGPAYEV